MPCMKYNTNGKEGKDKIYSIYLIYNTTNGKLYVGQSKDPKRRWKRHKSTAAGPCQKNAIHWAIKKYGSNKFIFKIVDSNLTLNEANKKEIAWISLLKDLKYQLYNETNGGDGTLGYEVSEEERKRRSERMKGENNYFYGKRLCGPANGHYGHKMKDHVKKELLKHRTKLTDKQVSEIKALYSMREYNQTELSKMYDVSLTQIHRIVHGKRRRGNKNIKGPLTKRQLRKEDVIQMREEYKNSKVTYEDLSKKYGVSIGHISAIINRKKWKNV